MIMGCDNKMKILHLISGGDTGGAKTHVITLLKRLMKNGINVELLCIIEGVFAKEARESGIKVKIIKQKSRYDINTIFKIRNYIKSEKFDLVHCHGARANYLAFFVKIMLKIPFITTIHSDYKLDFKDSFYKQAVFMPINAIAIRSFDYILAVTNAFKIMLIQRGIDEKKITVIYNGINIDEFDLSKIKPKNDFLKEYNIKYDENCIYIGIAARLQIVKGIKYLLEASNEILKTNKNIVVLIAGNGLLEKSIKEFINENNISNNVKLLGFVKDINSFYNAIDINILTSNSESFPYCLLEGARLKKPTIATNVGGIPEMIKNNETGLLIKPFSSKDIVDKINEFIHDMQKIEKFGQKFYEDICDNFSDEKMAKTHIQIYNKIIKSVKEKK